MIAALSADIVRSTSLSTEDLIVLRNEMKRFLDNCEKDYPGFWARIVRGDSIECVVPEYKNVLRIAILMKLYVKTIVHGFDCSDQLKKRGIRFSIGIGDIKYADKDDDIINGPAIYLSGRNLDTISRMDTVFTAFELESAPRSFNNLMDSYVVLLSNLVDSYSAKQAEVVFYKLLGYKEIEISERLGIYQSAVNTRSTNAQWGALNTAIRNFERMNFEKLSWTCG